MSSTTSATTSSIVNLFLDKIKKDVENNQISSEKIHLLFEFIISYNSIKDEVRSEEGSEGGSEGGSESDQIDFKHVMSRYMIGWFVHESTMKKE